MSHTLPDGTVIGEDALAALKAARSTNQTVLLRLPELVIGCPNCRDLGVLWFAFLLGKGSPIPTGVPKVPRLWDNGLWYDYESKQFDCPVCNESGPDRIWRLWQDSGLAPTERSWHLDYLHGRDGKGEALAAAHDLLTTVPRPSGWACFFGAFGVGKTGLLKSLVGACVRAGVSARYVRGLDILSEARATYGEERGENERDLIARYARYQFLAVDEVDRMSGTEWARAMLFQVLDDRYTRRESVATAIATNSAPGEMADLWGYLESRMRDGARIVVGGDDLRGGAA